MCRKCPGFPPAAIGLRSTRTANQYDTPTGAGTDQRAEGLRCRRHCPAAEVLFGYRWDRVHATGLFGIRPNWWQRESCSVWNQGPPISLPSILAAGRWWQRGRRHRLLPSTGGFSPDQPCKGKAFQPSRGRHFTADSPELIWERERHGRHKSGRARIGGWFPAISTECREFALTLGCWCCNRTNAAAVTGLLAPRFPTLFLPATDRQPHLPRDGSAQRICGPSGDASR